MWLSDVIILRKKRGEVGSFNIRNLTVFLPDMMRKIRATMLIADKFLGEKLIETKIALIHIVFSFKVILLVLPS